MCSCHHMPVVLHCGRLHSVSRKGQMMPKDEVGSLLGELGLSGYEATAYLTLLRREVFAPAELSLVAHIPRQRIYDVIASLEEKGLCQPRTTSPRAVAATPPGLALSALKARRVHELEKEKEKVQGEAGELTRRLEHLYEEGQRQRAPFSYLELYRDPAQMAAVAGELAAGAKTQIKLCLRGPSPFEPKTNSQLLGLALARGVSCRVLVAPGVFFSREFGALLTTYHRRGLAIKRLEGGGLPTPRLQIVDEHAVLLFFPEPLAGPPSFQAVAIRHPEMVGLMNFTFESLWELKRAKELDAQEHTL